MKNRLKELVAGFGLLVFTLYLSLYFIRSRTTTFNDGEKTTLRIFPTYAEMRVYDPLLRVEEYFRSEVFGGSYAEWDSN